MGITNSPVVDYFSFCQCISIYLDDWYEYEEQPEASANIDEPLPRLKYGLSEQRAAVLLGGFQENGAVINLDKTGGPGPRQIYAALGDLRQSDVARDDLNQAQRNTRFYCRGEC